MTQQINLYQPIFRKEKKVFSARTLLLASAVITAGLMLIYGFGAWSTHQLKQELTRLQSTEKETLRRFTELSASLKPKPKSALLEQKVQRRKADLARKHLLMRYLENGEFGNREGFSVYMEGFARQKIRDLWLTGFQISRGGLHVQLHGQTLAPVYVPQYLQRLSQEPAFAGKAFQTMKMQRSEDKDWALDFSVATLGESK